MHSTRSIYVAVGTLVLTMGVGSYVDIENDAMHARHLEINTGLERMVRLNQNGTYLSRMTMKSQAQAFEFEGKRGD
ncbi:hypothetical protein [Rhodoferax sp.]|uniref:hypothetical protein n=1 Tax=Rhodoferax sp. TaxID=50421 RepID=UPI00277A6E9B|nr:hypothetical protein [Rhodoferax sp.]